MFKSTKLIFTILSTLTAITFLNTGAQAGEFVCFGIDATIVGSGNIIGTDGDDVILGGPENDTIDGKAGDDIICGGLGNDTITGGVGDDDIYGQGGDDTLYGGVGDDLLDGGQPGNSPFGFNTGDDVLYGGNGNDILHTSDYPILGSKLYGGNGADQIYVWSGGFASGGNGDDELFQYDGDTTLEGGRGDDLLVNWDDPYAEVTDETVIMSGGRGDDVLINEDNTGTTAQNGGRGFDACSSTGAGATSMSDCEY